MTTTLRIVCVQDAIGGLLAIDQLKRYYKLDKPIPVGYLIWLGLYPDEDKDGAFSGILQGDFGVSYRYSESVLSTIVSTAGYGIARWLS